MDDSTERFSSYLDVLKAYVEGYVEVLEGEKHPPSREDMREVRGELREELLEDEVASILEEADGELEETTESEDD